MEGKQLKVLVVGATGGSGRSAVAQLLAAGHVVTAFSRRAETLAGLSPLLRVLPGDATDAGEVERAIQGQDAVIVTLGISDNPLWVRLRANGRTPLDVRSAGTRNVIAAMKRAGVRRLVVQSSYGVGETRHRLAFGDRLIFALLLRPQIDDTEVQEQLVRHSGLDWVLAQPVHLTDDQDPGQPFVSSEGETRQMKVSRARVGRFLVEAVRSEQWLRKTVSLSSP